MTSRRAAAKAQTPPTAKTSPSKTTPPPPQRAGGGLPWCYSGARRGCISRVVDCLTSAGQRGLLGVAVSRFTPAVRHVATQSILLNTLRLALTPGSRPDLHPVWFTFLLGSLPHWGVATAYMINLVVGQLGGAMQLLAAPFFAPGGEGL